MSVLRLYYCGSTLLNENNSAETKMRKKIELEYYSIENKKYNKTEETTIYGISILKREYNENNINIEKHSVEEVSTSKSRIMNIIELLKNCKVTPIALDDVLDDLLKQAEFQTA